MHSRIAFEDSARCFWPHVRRFAVPPTMIEAATARRRAGDWAGACAAARVDVDLDLRVLRRVYGAELAGQVRTDLRRLAPDLLRWHMPRVAPDGLLRPGLTMSLATYGPAPPGRAAVQLVVRTAPAWASAGQRISLAVWDGRRTGTNHPHPHPDPRFRLDLHRHLWAADEAWALRERAGRGGPPATAPRLHGCAVDRWAAEAAILLGTQTGTGDAKRAGSSQRDAVVVVRLGGRRTLLLDVASGALTPGDRRAGPVLPDAATWVLPDLVLLQAGLLDAGELHPLVAGALVPGYRPVAAPDADPAVGARFVDCRGARHRIGLDGGVLVAFDHDPAEVRRETLLVALGGTPLPCLRVIDEVHRAPENLTDVRARLEHGDVEGALAVVEALLGPGAVLRHGALRDELETAARRRVEHGLFRAGLSLHAAPYGPPRTASPHRRGTRR